MTDDFLAHALKVIPGGSSTNAKAPSRMARPLFAASAAGCEFKDREGRRWVDWNMALGAVIWGHGRPEITDAIVRQCSRGIIYSAPAALEIEVASRLLDRLQDFDALRFFKTGSEATSAAIRIARAATGRDDVVCATYHGWHDWSAYHHYARRAILGIPEPRGIRWAAAESFDAFAPHLDRVAAAVVCPEHWSVDQLRDLRERCTREGIVLVFDEVKSGMRFGGRGVFGSIGVTPDLLCMSKGLANGMPLAVTAGKDALMRYAYDAQISGTYSGECISLAAAAASEELLRELASWPPWQKHAEEVMERATAAIRDTAAPLEMEGYAGCFRLRGREGLSEHLADRGMFSSGWILPSAAHEPRHYAALAEALVQFIRK